MKLNLRDFHDLERQKLVTIKVDMEKGLAVVKYSRNVFYSNLWNMSPLLLEARGSVFDVVTGECVQRPFAKVFNHHENGTECELDRLVDCPVKVNGFMAAASYHKGELFVTTTGSMDSDFQKLAYKHLEHLEWDAAWRPEAWTHIFEICDPSDPHIVEEQQGAYLIGIRCKETGTLAMEYQTDEVAAAMGASRPLWEQKPFGEILADLKEVKHEGFMVRDSWSGDTILKLKSPHYLSKKFLMRMGKHKARDMFQNPIKFKMELDEEFYEVFDYIIRDYTFEAWSNLTDQDRRAVMEDFL